MSINYDIPAAQRLLDMAEDRTANIKNSCIQIC